MNKNEQKNENCTSRVFDDGGGGSRDAGRALRGAGAKALVGPGSGARGPWPAAAALAGGDALGSDLAKGNQPETRNEKQENN